MVTTEFDVMLLLLLLLLAKRDKKTKMWRLDDRFESIKNHRL
jgi:hypothetical protein